MSDGRVHCQGLHVCVCVCPGAVFMNVYLRRGCFRCHGKFLRSSHTVGPGSGVVFGVVALQEAPPVSQPLGSHPTPPILLASATPPTHTRRNKEPLCLCASKSMIHFGRKLDFQTPAQTFIITNLLIKLHLDCMWLKVIAVISMDILQDYLKIKNVILKHYKYKSIIVPLITLLFFLTQKF